jgi:hypothetical protein
MKKLGLRFLASVAIILSLTTCSKDHLFDCLTSSGNAISQWRVRGKFTNLNLNDDVDVVLYFGSANSIKVTAGEHLIDGIITELNGNTLYIRNENKCNWVRSFKNKFTVEICMDSVSNIYAYGAGVLTCHDTIISHDFTYNAWNVTGSAYLLFHNENIHINNNVGRADIHAAGKSGVAYGSNSDVGTFDAKNLISDIWYFRSNSTGESHINAKNILEADILYSGDVYYSGTASSITRTGNGTGRFIRE